MLNYPPVDSTGNEVCATAWENGRPKLADSVEAYGNPYSPDAWDLKFFLTKGHRLWILGNQPETLCTCTP